MVNQLLCVLFQTSSGILFGSAFELMLDIRKNRLKKWHRMLLWYLLYLSMSAAKILIDNSAAVSLVINGYWLIVSLVFLYFFYDEPFWKKIIALICLHLANFGGEIGCILSLPILGMDTFSMDYRNPDMVLGCFICAMVSAVFTIIVVRIWNRCCKRGAKVRHPFLLVLLPLCLVTPMYQYGVMIWEMEGLARAVNMISMVAAFVFLMLFIVVLFSQADKEAMERELTEMKFRSQLEQQHYKAVEARREELSKIRHDYNNLLTSVWGLMQMGEYEHAQEALDHLLTRVSQTRECSYCGVPIVNALLSEKQAVCDREGIRLTADLILPEDIQVEAIDLCSMFSNLMDNAIRACTQLPPEQRRITITAGMRGDYLIVRCENPAAKAPGPIPEGTGYGKRILRDIAQRWGGSFETAFEDGIHTATVILMEKK